MRFTTPFHYLLMVCLGVFLTEVAAIPAVSEKNDTPVTKLIVPLTEKEATSKIIPDVEVPTAEEIASRCHTFYSSCVPNCRLESCKSECAAVRDECLGR